MSGRALVAMLLAATLAVAAPVRACINETGTSLSGERVDLTHLAAGPVVGEEARARMLQYHVDRTAEVVARARERRDFTGYNDLAALLLHLGRPQDALDLLQVLERRWPGHYEAATNLGTAYELLGRDDDALRWIREGIVRNPESHDGSEWLHVRILEAKIAAAAGTPLSANVSLLGLEFGDAVHPQPPRPLPAGNDGRPVSPSRLGLSLHRQLHERSQLVPAPDPVVASLILDLATLELWGGTLERAVPLFVDAIAYGVTETPLIAARRAEAERVLASADPDAPANRRCAICEYD